MKFGDCRRAYRNKPLYRTKVYFSDPWGNFRCVNIAVIAQNPSELSQHSKARLTLYREHLLRSILNSLFPFHSFSKTKQEMVRQKSPNSRAISD